MNLAKVFQEMMNLCSIEIIQNDRPEWPAHTGEESRIEISRDENSFTIAITDDADGSAYYYALQRFGLFMSLNVYSPRIHVLFCHIHDRDAAAELYYRVMQGLITEEIEKLTRESTRLAQEQSSPWPRPV